MHLPGDWSGLEDLSKSSVSNHEQLEVEFKEPDNEEPPVAVNAFEDVELWVSFSSKLSAVEHVEQVHHNEGLEHQRVVL